MENYGIYYKTNQNWSLRRDGLIVSEFPFRAVGRGFTSNTITKMVQTASLFGTQALG